MTLVLQGLAAAHRRNGDSARWGAAILVAALLHAAGAIGLWRWREPVAPLIAIPPATFIDLAPLPAPPVPPPALQSPEPLEIPPDAAPPESVQPPEAIEPPEPVALPKPPPTKPKPRPVARLPVRPQAMPQTAQQEAAAPAATPTPVPVASAARSALPSFSALVAAQLERNKRYPTLAQRRGEEGTALLRFSIDRSGNVVSAQIERSSGHMLLDDEVMALLRRAAPLPAPPADIHGDAVTLIVPVSFSLRGRGD